MVNQDESWENGECLLGDILRIIIVSSSLFSDSFTAVAAGAGCSQLLSAALPGLVQSPAACELCDCDDWPQTGDKQINRIKKDAAINSQCMTVSCYMLSCWNFLLDVTPEI